MIIKSIQLCNFRQYKGEQMPIVFSTDEEQNVTIILGVNTSGKTTLSQAFRWCLYDQCNYKPQELLNREVEDDMNPGEAKDVYVEIILEHEKREYQIRRTNTYYMNEKYQLMLKNSSLKVQYREDDGQTQPVRSEECEDTINKILPEDLSDYFFFDGEQVSEINNKRDVAKAVRGLLGIDVIAEARDRLDPKRATTVTGKFIKELDIGSDDKSMGWKTSLAQKQSDRDEYITRRDNAKKEIEGFEQRKEDLASLLKANEDVKILQKERETLERIISQTKDSIEKSKKRIKADFGRGAVAFFAIPAIDRAMKVIDNAKEFDEGIPEMRRPAIDHILNRGYCICGTDLTNNAGAVEKVEYEGSLIPPAHIGTEISNKKREFNRYLQESVNFPKETIDNFKDFKRLLNQLDIHNKQMGDVSEKISGSGNIDISRLESEYRQNEIYLKDKTGLFHRLNQQIEDAENIIERAEKEIEKLAQGADKNQKLLLYIDYATAVFNWLNDTYIRKEKEVKGLLLESVNHIFKKMYHGERSVDMDENYHIKLLTTSLGATDESKGLETVKNFAFIAGLVDLARRKVQSADDIDDMDLALEREINESIEPYPLVMDAPFSNADEIHIQNISDILPDIAEQVILIVMEKDWIHAQETLSKKVGKSYRIEKINNSETNSKIVEGGAENV